MTGHIVLIDASDEDAVKEAVAVETSATQAVRPAWTPLPVQTRLRALTHPGEWSVRLFGVRDGDRLVGFGQAMVAADTPDTGWIFADVDPAHQGRGFGRLLAQAAEASLPGTVRQVVSRAYRRGSEEINQLFDNFAAPLGFAVATTETVVELDLAAAALPPCPTPTGYRVSTHVDGVAHELREQVGQLIGLVDAEAPNGALGWDATPVSPVAYAAEISQRRAQGRTTVETVAVSPDGDVTAWTCVVVPPNLDRAAAVEGTLVVSTHRGRGLGAAVKHANLVHLRDRHQVRRVSTSSDDTNRWMRAVNDKLGFRPAEVEAIFQKHREITGPPETD